jgi:hypothetical protein
VYYTSAYVAPPESQLPADVELRRLRRFVAYVLSGQLGAGGPAAREPAAADEAVVHSAIERKDVALPQGSEVARLATALPTHADGGLVLDRAVLTWDDGASHRAGVPATHTLPARFWSQSPFIVPPSEWEAWEQAMEGAGAAGEADAGSSGTLLRHDDRPLDYSDFAQSTYHAGLDGGRGRQGVSRRIQELKEESLAAERKARPLASGVDDAADASSAGGGSGDPVDYE